jgi:GNAT superfamily N-acetyltransferase
MVATDCSAATDLRMDESDGFSCTVTGYQGFERDILRLRNANRDHAETLEYLDWRYQSSPDAPHPRVFWLASPDGERIGMGSAVFRPYWIGGARVQIAVLGDISLDTKWRGRGFGLRLIRFMTAWLDEHFPKQPALVIPTEPARRVLLKAGWLTVGSLVPHVYVLDGTHYANTLVHNDWLASRIAMPLRSVARSVARLHVPRDGTLHLTDALDAPLLDFARSLPAARGAVRDLGPESLSWRYTQHPHTRFRFGAFSRAGKLRGLLIYEDASLEQCRLIYDVVAATAADVRAMLALFILRGLDTPGLASLRITINERHPWASCLRMLGFISRHPDTVFQVHSTDGVAESLPWSVTQGDKDT